MKKKEALDLIERVMVNYQQFQPANMELAVAEWSEVLDGVSYDDASFALTEYVRQGHEFPPNPGLLLGLVNKRKAEKAAVARDPADAFRRGYKCKCCKDTGFVTRKVYDKAYGYEVEVAMICGECNMKAAVALNVSAFHANDGFRPCNEPTPFDDAV